jgi:hypothetical protein
MLGLLSIIAQQNNAESTLANPSSFILIHYILYMNIKIIAEDRELIAVNSLKLQNSLNRIYIPLNSVCSI